MIVGFTIIIIFVIFIVLFYFLFNLNFLFSVDFCMIQSFARLLCYYNCIQIFLSSIRSRVLLIGLIAQV